jgi:hypothetical protein
MNPLKWLHYLISLYSKLLLYAKCDNWFKVKVYLRKIGWIVWNGLESSGSGWGPVVSSCEHGNEPLGSIKY